MNARIISVIIIIAMSVALMSAATFSNIVPTAYSATPSAPLPAPTLAAAVDLPNIVQDKPRKKKHPRCKRRVRVVRLPGKTVTVIKRVPVIKYRTRIVTVTKTVTVTEPPKVVEKPVNRYIKDVVTRNKVGVSLTLLALFLLLVGIGTYIGWRLGVGHSEKEELNFLEAMLRRIRR